MTTRFARARAQANQAMQSQRQMRERMRVLAKQRRAALHALVALIDEPQPLGIERPAYRRALAVIRESEADRD